jgi:hypothetical protein
MSTVSARYRVQAPPDFAPVERHVSSLLSGEGDRCSFLRSASFLRFRVRCLYRPRGRVPPCWTGNGQLVLEFEREPPPDCGGWVSVVASDRACLCDYDESWGQSPDDEDEGEVETMVKSGSANADV